MTHYPTTQLDYWISIFKFYGIGTITIEFDAIIFSNYLHHLHECWKILADKKNLGFVLSHKKLIYPKGDLF